MPDKQNYYLIKTDPHLLLQVVVKPSGPECFQCVGVTFHDKEEIADITDAVMALFTDLQPECAVLIETFVEPIQPRKSMYLTFLLKLLFLFENMTFDNITHVENYTARKNVNLLESLI